MFKSSLVAAVGAALALTAFTAPPVLAQHSTQEQQAQQSTDLPGRDVDETAQGRSERRSDSRIRRGRGQQAAPATPEENIAAAQAIATAAGAACQVTQANLLGQTAERNSTYEAACAAGPGYILISTTPPQAIDCVLLAGQAEIDRARDPAGDPGTQCVIPQNADVLRVISAYATEAGVSCTVDQGASIGRASNGNLIYEVGCAGVDGYWLEKEAANWKKTECAIIVTQNATCRYSTAAEAAATFKTRLAGSEAANCDVTQGRFMGSNANGAFWEAKCAAGNGVIVRFNPEYAVQQIYPCEVAHRIGGGCTLTIVPPPAEEPAAPAAPQ
ncbi:hypothetical protein [Brevundimonas sp.]